MVKNRSTAEPWRISEELSGVWLMNESAFLNSLAEWMIQWLNCFVPVILNEWFQLIIQLLTHYDSDLPPPTVSFSFKLKFFVSLYPSFNIFIFKMHNSSINASPLSCVDTSKCHFWWSFWAMMDFVDTDFIWLLEAQECLIILIELIEQWNPGTDLMEMEKVIYVTALHQLLFYSESSKNFVSNFWGMIIWGFVFQNQNCRLPSLAQLAV